MTSFLRRGLAVSVILALALQALPAAALIQGANSLSTEAGTVQFSELQLISGLTAGTTAASKALVVDANKALDVLTVGTLTTTAPPVASAATGLTAHAGGGQASALVLAAGYNNITVCATAADSVKLPVASLGKVVTVRNVGAASCDVYPVSGSIINGLAANVQFHVPVGGEVTFYGTSATAWVTRQSAVFPAPSANKGTLVIKAADSAGDTQTIVTNGSQAQADTLTIPDPGAAAASFVLSTGTSTATTATSTELNTVSGVTPGTTAASKALVVDSNSALDTLTVTTPKAGKSGTAGTLSVFPTTASKGSTTLTASDNSGNTVTNINTAAQTGARTYTIPDGGASANVLLTTGAATALTSTSAAMQQVFSAFGSITFDRCEKIAKVALLNTHVQTGGGVFSWANPEGATIAITRVDINVATIATNACLVDVGVAANGTTLNDTLLDGVDLHAATGLLTLIDQAGANGKNRSLCTTSQSVTGSNEGGAGDTTGLVGFAYIHYFLI